MFCPTRVRVGGLGMRRRGLEKRARADGGEPRFQGRRPELTLGSMGYYCKISS